MASVNFSSDPCRSIGFKSSTITDLAYDVGQPAYVINIRVANVLGSTATVTIKWTNSANATDYTLIDTQTVPAHSYANYEFSAFMLKRGDKIKITGSVNNAFHCLLTAVELPGRSV